jgi:glyoxylase-like metal-dependent hydrolase (beta-lactamase superfamily II)
MLSVFSKNVSIHSLDSIFMDLPSYTSVYLIKDSDGEASIFDTGTPKNYPILKSKLKDFGVSQTNLKSVILSHVHLDHCGNASLLARDFPLASFYVHPHGVPHLVDPSSLLNVSRRLFKERIEREYGDHFFGVSQNRIIPTHDQMIIKISNLCSVKVLHTPGHAQHHISIIEPETQTLLTGETFGSKYSDIDDQIVFASTSPAAFDPDQMISSIKKISSETIKQFGIAHFGFHSDFDSHKKKCFSCQTLFFHVRLCFLQSHAMMRVVLFYVFFGGEHDNSMLYCENMRSYHVSA